MNEALTATKVALDAKRSAARTAWKALEGAKKTTLAAGARALSPTSPEFLALDKAGRDYDALQDEIASGERTLARMAETLFDGDYGPDQGQTSSPAVDLASFSASFKSWRSSLDTDLNNPSARFGASPTLTLISKRDVKAALTTTTSYPSVPWRRPGVIPMPLADLSLLDVIPIVPVDNDIVQLVVEDTFTNAAVETAEGTAAGEGAIHWTMRPIQCHWIPFTLPASRQLLDDMGMLESFLTDRMVYGVRARLQSQIINGDGIGQNILGILSTPNLPVAPYAKGDVPFDAIHHAMTTIRVATKGTWVPNTLLIHPADWSRLVLAKNGLGIYYAAGPFTESMPTVWGLRVVQHVDIPEGSPIVCDSRAMELYVREDVSVAISDSHEDQFVKGIIQVLASGRFGFAVLDRRAVCEVTTFDAS